METRQQTELGKRKLARRRPKISSVHLMLLVFVFIMAFGGVMKMICQKIDVILTRGIHFDITAKSKWINFAENNSCEKSTCNR